jgi:hypothetical protein
MIQEGVEGRVWHAGVVELEELIGTRREAGPAVIINDLLQTDHLIQRTRGVLN